MYYGAPAVSRRSGIVRSLRSIKALRAVVTLGALVVWARGYVKNEEWAKNFFVGLFCCVSVVCEGK